MLDSIWTVFLAPHALNWAQWYVLLFLKCKTKYWTAVLWVTLSGWTMKSSWWHHGC